MVATGWLAASVARCHHGPVTATTTASNGANAATGDRSSIEFYFDFSCPYAYLASTQIEAIAARGNASLRYRPMLLGGIFRELGLHHTPMNTLAPAKARHNLWDMHRYADRFAVPLEMPDGHPVRTVRALRALLSLPESIWPAVIHTLFSAYWVTNEDLSQPEVLAALLSRAGVGEAEVVRAIDANEDAAIKDDLRARTDEALARGVFGAPTMFVTVGGEPASMWWGQDRLPFVERMLDGWRPGQAFGGTIGSIPMATEEALADRTVPAPPPGLTVEFYYDVSSPFSYLAATQIERVVAAGGATLVWKPMLLGGLFRAIGTADAPMLAMSASRQRYTAADLDTWANAWGVPFRFTSRFPMRTVTAMRLAIAAQERIAEMSHLLYRALWVEDLDLADESVLRRLLVAGGFDAERLLAMTQQSEIKAALIANTESAERAGVFGAPTMIVHHPDRTSPALLWGQDRLGLLADICRGYWPTHG